MRLCDLDEIKIQVKRQYEDCHGYSGNKKAIYREAILAVRSILHSAKIIDAAPVVRCRECKYRFKNNGHSKDGCPIIDANIWMDDDDFCSHGERKEGDDE